MYRSRLGLSTCTAPLAPRVAWVCLEAGTLNIFTGVVAWNPACTLEINRIECTSDGTGGGSCTVLRAQD
jgi:hypothetical protein